jgi:hypothetical protein
MPTKRVHAERYACKLNAVCSIEATLTKADHGDWTEHFG